MIPAVRQNIQGTKNIPAVHPHSKKKISKGYIGDIAICYEIVNQRSKKTNFKYEFDKMWLHGYLHLLGYDHKNNSDYNEMLNKEQTIIKDFDYKF